MILCCCPNGTVMAIGGSNDLVIDSRNGVFPTEIWDPTTETWTTTAALTDPRMYHSTPLSLPDGRILSAGGGRFGNAVDYLSAQSCSPPYLFQGTRPTKSGAPSQSGYGDTLAVSSPDAVTVSKVVFMRVPAVTHTVDTNQATWSRASLRSTEDCQSRRRPIRPSHSRVNTCCSWSTATACRRSRR